LEKQLGVLELLLLPLPQPPTASPAAATRDIPATAGRQRVPIAPPACPAIVFRSTPMTASLSARHPVRVTPLASRRAGDPFFINLISL
jgi:hypothetical protein